MNIPASLLDLRHMHSWEKYSTELDVELRQCLDEGRDVGQYADVVRAVQALPESALREELADALYPALTQAPIRADYPYDEPDDIDEIRSKRPDAPALEPFRRTGFEEKVRGAWLGRIAGCLLGKPVEGMRTPEMHKLLKNSSNFPLKRYMLLADLEKTPDLPEVWRDRTWADNIGACAPVDDDTNYTVMACKCLIERYGRGFTPNDVASVWMACQPKDAYCTAERRAFDNFVMGLRPPLSATYKNPDREYIGAQIRGDYFGYICPGDPETAADMAWRDACISHVKNGIYGEMYVSAMLAAAAVTDDIPAIVRAGLGQIPKKCRLTEAVEHIVALWQGGKTEDECFADIASRWDEFKGYDWVHTISNAEIVTACLLYGGGDYAHSICRAVQTGFDTDCNGATVGSIIGMMKGDKAIPAAWTAPFHGMLDTSICGTGRVSIDELVALTIKHAEV